MLCCTGTTRRTCSNLATSDYSAEAIGAYCESTVSCHSTKLGCDLLVIHPSKVHTLALNAARVVFPSTARLIYGDANTNCPWVLSWR